MGTNIAGTSWIIYSMVKVSTSGKQMHIFMDTSFKGLDKVRELGFPNLIPLFLTHTKVNIRKIKKMALEYTNGQMEQFTRGILKMT